jgi:hypothetical protein
MTTYPAPPLFSSQADKAEAHRATIDQVEAAADAGGAKRQAEADRVRRELVRYLTTLGIGTRFQAIDFTNWLAGQHLLPDPAVYDGRAIGGLFSSLRRGGLIEILGYQPDGGSVARNCNSTTRPLYAVRSLDFTSIGWAEQEAR